MIVTVYGNFVAFSRFTRVSSAGAAVFAVSIGSATFFFVSFAFREVYDINREVLATFVTVASVDGTGVTIIARDFDV
jgi:hypothetical protein